LIFDIYLMDHADFPDCFAFAAVIAVGFDDAEVHPLGDFPAVVIGAVPEQVIVAAGARLPD